MNVTHGSSGAPDSLRDTPDTPDIPEAFDAPVVPEALRDALERKDARRRRLAALPFPEKIAIVVQLQARFAPIYRARGREYRVWNPTP